MPPKRTSTSAAPAMTQAAIRQLIVDGIAAALEAQVVTITNTDNPNRNTRPRETPELAVLCPNMVPNSKKLMEVFIRGLPRSIEGNVTASKPQTLEEAITITQRLMEQVIKHNSAQETNGHKRKFKDRRNTTDNNNNHSNNRNNDNYQNNHNNHNCNNDYHQQQNRRQETIRTYAATPTENKRLAFAAICQKYGCYRFYETYVRHSGLELIIWLDEGKGLEQRGVGVYALFKMASKIDKRLEFYSQVRETVALGAQKAIKKARCVKCKRDIHEKMLNVLNEYDVQPFTMCKIFFIIFSIAVQTLDSGISNLLAVGTTFTGSGNLYCQWELSPGSGNALCILFPTWEQPSLAVGTYTASGNSLLAVGMPCAFYSQQSSPKLDAPSALKFSRIK
nr:reverse transcriptase domain-containing protein [Tanacetum cinerariifolium]